MLVTLSSCLIILETSSEFRAILLGGNVYTHACMYADGARLLAVLLGHMALLRHRPEARLSMLA